MGLISSYNLRSMIVRKGTAAMTAMGIAMVVAVFVMTLSIAQGFRSTLVASGQPDNVMVTRKSATSENVSAVLKPQVPILEAMPQVARGPDGQALVSPELVVIISLPRLTDNAPANVPLRGVGPKGFEVRNAVKMIAGRRFAPGAREINVGKQAVGRFKGLNLGDTVKFGNANWTIVGIFTADDASFESEVWGDVDLMMAAFQQRMAYQSATLKLTDPSAFESLQAAMAADPRLDLKAERERDYYEGQSATTSTLIRAFATFVTAILSIGAVFGAMNTMYAIVASRTREIGTLRALGFSRSAILFSFVVESVFLAVIGGLIGCLLAFPMHGFSTGTGQTQSFSEIAFNFRITPGIVLVGMTFAVVMGILGGLLPALRGARMPITSALREA